MANKPILFNTEMVKAIQAGCKTQTRRLVKTLDSTVLHQFSDVAAKRFIAHGKAANVKAAPCEPGDILWVRETWHRYTKRVGEGEKCRIKTFFGYKASMANAEDANEPWKPSIHMPKQAARIFLRVKDVRVERIQSITDADAHSEGVPEIGDYPINSVYCPRCKGYGLIGGYTGHGYIEVDCPDCRTDVQRFSHLWDSTIKPADRDKYGWDANPWVWVIEFERCEKPEDWV